METIGQFRGLSADASGKVYGIHFAKIAKNIVVDNKTLRPRSGQHFLSESDVIQRTCFGIQPIKFSTAKNSAIVIVGTFNGTNDAIFVYRTPRRLRVGF